MDCTTRWTVWGTNPRRSQTFYYSSKHPDYLCSTPSSLGTGSFFWDVKKSGCEINHSPVSSTVVNIQWAGASAVHICPHVEDRENNNNSNNDNNKNSKLKVCCWLSSKELYFYIYIIFRCNNPVPCYAVTLILWTWQ